MAAANQQHIEQLTGVIDQISRRLEQINSESTSFAQIFSFDVAKLREKLASLCRLILVSPPNPKIDSMQIYETMRNRLIQDVVLKFKKFSDENSNQALFLRYLNARISYFSCLTHEIRGDCNELLFRLNIGLGDLCRYGSCCDGSFESEKRDFFDLAQIYYRTACALDPSSGCGFNQLGVLYTCHEGFVIEAIYCYLVCLNTQKSLRGSLENLRELLLVGEPSTKNPIEIGFHRVIALFLVDFVWNHQSKLVVENFVDLVRNDLPKYRSILKQIILSLILIFEQNRTKPAASIALALSFALFSQICVFFHSELSNDQKKVTNDETIGIFDEMFIETNWLMNQSSSPNEDETDLCDESDDWLARKMAEFEFETDSETFDDFLEEYVFEMDLKRHELARKGFEFAKSNRDLIEILRVYCLWLSLNRKLIRNVSQYKETWHSFAQILNSLPNERIFVGCGMSFCDLRIGTDNRSKYSPVPIDDDLELRSLTCLKRFYSRMDFGQKRPRFEVDLDFEEQLAVRICSLRHFAHQQCRSNALVLRIPVLFDYLAHDHTFRAHEIAPKSDFATLEQFVSTLGRDVALEKLFELAERPSVVIIHSSSFFSEWKRIFRLPYHYSYRIVFPYTTFTVIDDLKKKDDSVQMVSMWIMMNGLREAQSIETYSRLDFDDSVDEVVGIYEELESLDDGAKIAILVSADLRNRQTFSRILGESDGNALVAP